MEGWWKEKINESLLVVLCLMKKGLDNHFYIHTKLCFQMLAINMNINISRIQIKTKISNVAANKKQYMINKGDN